MFSSNKRQKPIFVVVSFLDKYFILNRRYFFIESHVFPKTFIFYTNSFIFFRLPFLFITLLEFWRYHYPDSYPNPSVLPKK